MGAIAAVFAKRSNQTSMIDQMLESLKHRGTHTRIMTAESSKDRTFTFSIGCVTYGSLDEQMSDSHSVTLATDGSFYEIPKSKQTRFLSRRFQRSQTLRSVLREVVEEPGGFSCIFKAKSTLHAFRDIKGLKPLYFSRKRNVVAFASERKALWRIGFQRVERVIPGYHYRVSTSGLRETRLAQIRSQSEIKMTLRRASAKLARLLERSIRRITKGTDSLAVAFSGGLDSALTALLAKQAGKDVELVTVGLPDSPELSTAEKYAQTIGLPNTIQAFPDDSLEEYVRRVLWLIEEPNLMKVSVAVPLHWAASVAARRGLDVMLCGQGSDELYGGYYKYARTLDTRGRKALVRELYRSVVNAAEVNYERDDQATAPFGIELRTPFADLNVIRFSLQIPSELKVRTGNDLTRKWVLRTVAKEIGLPEDMVWRRKKAIQHGSGVENAIIKLAKQRNLTPSSYLSQEFQSVMMLDSMP